MSASQRLAAHRSGRAIAQASRLSLTLRKQIRNMPRIGEAKLLAWRAKAGDRSTTDSRRRLDSDPGQSKKKSSASAPPMIKSARQMTLDEENNAGDGLT